MNDHALVFKLSRFAYFRFVVNWAVCPLFLVIATTSFLNDELIVFQKFAASLLSIATALLIFLVSKSIVWKIILFSNELTIFTLFGKKQVNIHNIIEMKQRNRIMETIYTVSCRDGFKFKFSSGLIGYLRVLTAIRKELSKKRDYLEEIRLDLTTTSYHACFLLLSLVAGGFASVNFCHLIVEIFAHQQCNPAMLIDTFCIWWLSAISFLLMLIRARAIELCEKELFIQTWAGKQKITWTNIQYAAVCPPLRCVLVRSRLNCYLVGEELLNFDLFKDALDKYV